MFYAFMEAFLGSDPMETEYVLNSCFDCIVLNSKLPSCELFINPLFSGNLSHNKEVDAYKRGETESLLY